METATTVHPVKMPPVKHWTYEDYYRLDDDKRYEVFEGELMMMTPAPSFKHQDVLARLGNLLFNHVHEKKKGKVVFVPVDVVLQDDEVFQPDIVFISNENSGVIKEAGIFGSPDLVVEILSPSSIYRDMEVKKGFYERAGIKEYWIVFPDENVIEVFALENGRYQLISSREKTGKIKSSVLDAELDITDAF